MPRFRGTEPTRIREIARATARLDELVASARARMPSRGDGLRPAEIAWMNEWELVEYHYLQLELIRLQPTRRQLQARVAKKRAARIKAMSA